MQRRLLVTSAGTGASNNLIRSLRAGEPAPSVVGCYSDRFLLKKSLAEKNHLVPPVGKPSFVEALTRVIRSENVELVIPANDGDVAAISPVRDALPCRVLLPRDAVLELCRDKYALYEHLRDRDIPCAATYPVDSKDSVERIFGDLSHSVPLWCRIRTGSGSRGAAPVKDPEQAWAWIRYWEEMRGVPATSFTISEYLPGRDFNAQGLWRDGRPVLLKMCERLSYLGGANTPSGMSSTPALARTVLEPNVLEICETAVHTIDPQISGVLNLDLKADADGVPCITEINAGRFAMITNIYDFTGKHNMATTFVALALGEQVEVRDVRDIVEDCYLVRDLDTEPCVLGRDAVFEGIEDTA